MTLLFIEYISRQCNKL